MIIEFQLIGEKRKELAKTISEIIGAPAEYQFMPTCAYKIGDFYTVTKEGNLEISDSADSKEIDMLISELASRGYDVPLDEEENGLTVEMVESLRNPNKTVKIAIVGKYTQLHDAYLDRKSTRLNSSHT